MFRSIVSNWTGHVVFLIAGFVIPRLVDRRLGPELLGVWDLGWSLTAYLDLALLGLTGAINRSVARHREARDWNGLNTAVNTSLLLCAASMLVGTAACALLVLYLPVLIKSDDAGLIREARWAFAVLGASAVVQLPARIFVGMVTGCARFLLKNVIRSGAYLLVLIGMILTLQFGFSITGLAAVTLAGEVLVGAAFAIASMVLLPELRFSHRFFRWAEAAALVRFGGKGMIVGIARTLLYQVNALLISSMLGPAALAVYSRQRALVRHIDHLLAQFGTVFVPASAALQARGDHDALARLLIRANKSGFLLALPAVVVLAVAGSPLMQIWMGPSYESPLVLTVLAVGHLGAFAHRGTYFALMGIDRHGVLAWIEASSTAVSIVLGWFFIGPLNLGLPGAAFALAVPLTLIVGLGTTIVIVISTRTTLFGLWRGLVAAPLLASVIYVACALPIQRVFHTSPGRLILAELLLAVLVFGPVYWRLLLPSSFRDRLRLRVFRGNARVARSLSE